MTTTAIAWGFFSWACGGNFYCRGCRRGWRSTLYPDWDGQPAHPDLHIPRRQPVSSLGFLVSNKLFSWLPRRWPRTAPSGIEEAILVPLWLERWWHWADGLDKNAGQCVCPGLHLCWSQPNRPHCLRVGETASFLGSPAILHFSLNPIDLIFRAVFKIELTDWWTLGAMVVFNGLGAYKQIKKYEGERDPPWTHP